MFVFLFFIIAQGTVALVCDQNSLCDNVMPCTAGLTCAQTDSLGIGRCCLNTDATTPGIITQFPLFGTTRNNFPGAFTKFPNIGGNTMNPYNPGSQFPGSCQDLPNPSTGVSDCHLRANLCYDSNYYDVMTRQCPHTCGRCGITQYGASSTRSFFGSTLFPGSGGCTDLINPSTGQSDCARHANLCFDQLYQNLMRIQCPRTCGMCSGIGISSEPGIGFTTRLGIGFTSRPGIGFTSTPSYNLFTQPGSFTRIGGTCVDALNPRSGKSDCGTLAYLCKRADYAALMRTQCPLTCRFC